MMVLKVLTTIGVGLCLVINVSIAHAELPWKKYIYFQNWGGLNDNLSTTEVKDNEATDIQNVVFDTGGAITKRYGYDTIPNNDVSTVYTGSMTNTGAITGVAFYEKDNGNRYLVAICNADNVAQVFKKDYESGGGWESGDWEVIAEDFISAYDDDYLVDFAQAEDDLVFTTPAAVGYTPYKWSGSGGVVSLTADANIPQATILEYHKNQLFLNDISNDSRIWFSALDDITTYVATDFIDIQTQDGTKVRAMKSAFNSLYIWKDDSVWRLSGYERDSFRLEKMVDGVGTLSQHSISVIGSLIFFVTSQGDIAAYDGGYQIKFISQKIRNTIGSLNFARAQYALGLPFSTYRYKDYDYYVSVSTSGQGSHNRVLMFDNQFKAWTKFAGMNVNAWTVAEDSNSQDVIVFGDYNGYIHYYPTATYYDGNVSTSAISALYQTKWFRYPEVCLGNKYWRLLKTYVLSESSDDTYLTVEARKDYAPSGTQYSILLTEAGSEWDVMQWDVDVWGGEASLIIDRQEIEKGTDMFQLEFTNDTVSQGFTILGFEMFIEPTTGEPD